MRTAQLTQGTDNFDAKAHRIKGLTGNSTWTANLTSPKALAEEEQAKL